MGRGRGLVFLTHPLPCFLSITGQTNFDRPILLFSKKQQTFLSMLAFLKSKFFDSQRTKTYLLMHLFDLRFGGIGTFLAKLFDSFLHNIHLCVPECLCHDLFFTGVVLESLSLRNFNSFDVMHLLGGAYKVSKFHR